MKHLHLKQAIKWPISTFMTGSSSHFEGTPGNFVDNDDMTLMISLTQRVTTSKGYQQGSVNQHLSILSLLLSNGTGQICHKSPIKERFRPTWQRSIKH